MANIAASTKLGNGFGQGNVDTFKFVCVSFATAATADVLIFDASNVGKENALSAIRWAVCVSATGVITSTIIASNQITVDPGNHGATQVTAFACGVGG